MPSATDLWLPKTCIYCGTCDEPTKEHVLPRSAGGVLTETACRPCNQQRGSSGDWRPFKHYIRIHPGTWAKALRASHGPDTVKWLHKWGLLQEAFELLRDP